MFSWAAVFVSCFTMIFSPLAMGYEAQRLTAQSLQQQLKDSGLDQQQTLAQFWEKNKSYFPKFVHSDLEQFIKENQNVTISQVQLTTSKSTEGEDVPTLRYSVGGKTHNLQIFGQANRWARLNGVNLSENDLANVDAVFKRLEASDLRLKKEADTYRQNVRKKRGLAVNDPEVTKKINQIRKDLWRFDGFPRVTPQLWASMNKEQRAGYIIQMRQMAWAARQVLDQRALSYGLKNSASLRHKDSIFELMIGEEAQANSGTGAKSIQRKSDRAKSYSSLELSKPENRNKPCLPNAPLNGRSCIAAGFVGPNESNNYSLTYNSNSPDSLTCGCSYESLTSNRAEKEQIQTLANECAEDNKQNNLKIRNPDKGAWVACNPLLYSYKESGRPYCVHTMSPGFQWATTYSANGSPTPSCDEQARLSASAFAVRDREEGFAGNERLAQIEKEQRSDDPAKDFLLTKNYLNGALKRAGQDKSLDELLSGEWNEKLDNQLVDIQKAFENEITKAIQLCSTNIGRGQEKNHLGACEQLHRRWLFTERFISKFRQKACDPDSEYIGAYSSGESSLTGAGAQKTKTNLTKIDDLRAAGGGVDPKLCACKNIMVKNCDKEDPTKCTDGPNHVKFGEKCGERTVAREEAQCPAGMSKENYNGNDPYCLCSGDGAGSVPLNIALERASLENGIEKMCNEAPAATNEKCGKPQGIANYNYDKCSCEKGELVDDNEPGFFGKIGQFISGNDEKKDPNWICKESAIWPWLLGGALLALLLFKKNKKDPPAQPPMSCAPKVGTFPNCVCPVNNSCNQIGQQYNMNTCSCDVRPVCADNSLAPGGVVANCPKCSDGSYKTVPSSTRPNGCPGEGGSGTPTCTNPDGCAGGVPGKQ